MRRPAPPLQSSREVAELFRVSVRTVQAWHRGGRLRGIRVGRDLRFHRRDVEALLGVSLDDVAPTEAA